MQDFIKNELKVDDYIAFSISKKPIKPSEKYPYGGYKIKHCPFQCYKFNKECSCKQEYCRYIKDFLIVQDDVKDCGINEE